MREVSHWDDAPTETEDLGPIAATTRWLSGAVGARRLGVTRNRVPAGKASTPQHAEDEEIFYVLDGDGWSAQEDGCFAIGPGDVVFYRPWGVAHTIVAGDGGIDYIAFGTSDPPRGLTRFPRIDRVKVIDHLVSGDRAWQWEVEARLPRVEVKDPPDPRPSTILNAGDVEGFTRLEATGKLLARPLGARGIALNMAIVGPQAEAAPLHCHSMEEELFVVLEGDGVLLLGNDEEEHPVRKGSVVGRPPGTGVGHAFRGGDRGMTLLMFSDKHPNDMTLYPRTGKVTLRGLGITIQPEIVPW